MLAQSTIKAVVTEIDMGGEAQPGVPIPAALEDGTYTAGPSGADIGDDALGVMTFLDVDPNTLDVFYVPRLEDHDGKVKAGYAYPKVWTGGIPNFIVLSATDKHDMAPTHEIMHILLNGLHRNDAPEAVFHERPAVIPVRAVKGSKRIGPHRQPAHVGDQDTFTIHASSVKRAPIGRGILI